MSAVTLPPSMGFGDLLDASSGVSPTKALRLWQRAATAFSMHASRFAAWHALERRADAAASYVALGIGCLAALAVFAIF